VEVGVATAACKLKHKQGPFRTSSPISDDSGLKARCSFQTTGASNSRPSEQKTTWRDGSTLWIVMRVGIVDYLCTP